MKSRYLVSMPRPAVGVDVLYRGPEGPAAGPWPAKLTRVRRDATEADPFGAVADLVVFTADGTVYLPSVPYGREPGGWHYPPPRPDPITAVIEEDDEAPGPVSGVPDAPQWYRKLLQGR